MKEMRCESDALMSIILDGETFYTHELELKVLPKAIRIVSPNGIGFAYVLTFNKAAGIIYRRGLNVESFYDILYVLVNISFLYPILSMQASLRIYQLV